MNGVLVKFLPLAVLGLGVLLISGIREQYAVQPVRPLATLPASINGIVGKSMAIDSAERRVAGMTDYSLRTYGPDSAYLFSTYVGYYDRQVQGKAIHSPKNCLPGAGWEIMSAERISADKFGATGGTINRVLLANQGVRALVYYWYQGRDRVEASEYQVKWNLLRDAAIDGRTEEALVRIVVPLPRTTDGSNERTQVATFASADSVASAVTQELLSSVSKVMPKLRNHLVR
jgi:EpsI family protein